MRRSAGHDGIVPEVDGVRYELDLGEVIDANLYYRGGYEPRPCTSWVTRSRRRYHRALGVEAERDPDRSSTGLSRPERRYSARGMG